MQNVAVAIGEEDQRVAVRFFDGCQKLYAGGRQAVEPIEGSHFTVTADLVIKALGFDAEDLPGMFNVPVLALTRWGTLKVNARTFETNLPGVFAAGDIVRGASLVVWAIRDGRDAAAQIHQHLEQRTMLAVAAQ